MSRDVFIATTAIEKGLKVPLYNYTSILLNIENRRCDVCKPYDKCCNSSKVYNRRKIYAGRNEGRKEGFAVIKEKQSPCVSYMKK